MSPDSTDVTITTIQLAQTRMVPYTSPTPMLESLRLNDAWNASVWVKPESLQPMGAFKWRGALNFVLQLPLADSHKPLVAYSSGNHAQAVAAVAELFNRPAIIVMPQDAPKAKIDNTRGYGAEVILYNRSTESREAIAQALVAERDGILIPPFDHPWIMSGQGTAGLEIAQWAQAHTQLLDAVFIPVGGGGLAAGCATALKALLPSTAVYGVEPHGYDDTYRSLVAGHRLAIHPTEPLFCDALGVTEPGELTFPIVQSLLTGIDVVTPDEVCLAMAEAFEYCRLVLEPGGAVGLAAARRYAMAHPNSHLAVIASGGNVDWGVYRQAMAHGQELLAHQAVV